jgi:hypothetical protein
MIVLLPRVYTPVPNLEDRLAMGRSFTQALLITALAAFFAAAHAQL